jgi:diketogulonate reductase-like aldo/keto reductase
MFVDLKNGVRMPALGLGVFLTPPAETAAAVTTAIEHGYRLIDTAAAYNNERQVGEGIRRSGIDRAEVFVTTKLWLGDYGYDSALRAFDASLRRLGLDYIDLWLLHWPVPSNFGATAASYRTAEELLAAGRARAIGVSNFTPEQLASLIRQADVIPAVNQVELHPYFIQADVRAADASHGVVTQSWSPIGGVYERNQAARLRHATTPLEHPAIVDLASAYGKTPAQIILRWHLEHGLSTIPKSVSSSRIAENVDIFDFALTAHEVAMIDELDKGIRGGSDPEIVDQDTFTVTIDE